MSGHSQILSALQGFRPFETAEERSARKTRQARAQMELLSKTTCQPALLGALNRRLGNVDAEEMHRMLKQDFYNGRVLNTVQCLLESISISTSSEMAVNFRIREFFRKLRQIGSSSVNGIAFQAGIQEVEKMFAIKVPREQSIAAAYHEALIGLRGLNQYRSQVPNFAYIFGLLRTSQPAVATDRSVITWSNNSIAPIPHVIYEFIPGPELSDYLKNCTLEDMLNIYLQACLALDVVFKGLDFTHYDAHTGNLMIRPMPSAVSIPYSTERGIEYLKTQAIATFIDYGYAHARIDGRMFGPIGFEKWGVEQRKSMPFHDAYKLLMFMLYQRRKYGKRDYLLFEPLLQIWNGPVPLDTLLDEQKEDLYALPRICISEGRACLEDVDLLKWVEEIRKAFPKQTQFLAAKPQSPVLSCLEGGCASKTEIQSELGLRSLPTVSSVISYFDLMSRSKLRPEIRSALDQVDISKMFVESLDSLRDLRDSLLNEISQLVRYRLIGDPHVFLTETFLRKYQDYAQRLAGIYDLFSNLSILFQSLEFVSQTHQLPEKQLREIQSQVQAQFPVLRNSARMMEQDIRTIESIRKEPLARERRRAIPDLEWYWSYLPDYLGMLQTPLQI